MVKGNAYATLKCSLDKLQKEGLKEKVLDFLSVRCDFNVYDVKNLTAEEATILTTKIRDRKKMLKQMEKVIHIYNIFYLYFIIDYSRW